MVTRHNRSNRNGLTILELIVALSISAAVISVVYYTWNFLNKHIAKHTNSALVSDAADRLAHSIASQIRRSPAILKWDNHSIKLLSAENSDTVTWDFDGENLLRNGDSVQVTIHGSRISNFEVKDLRDLGLPENSLNLLLQISLTVNNEAGDSSRVDLTVKARKSGINDDGFGNNFW